MMPSEEAIPRSVIVYTFPIDHNPVESIVVFLESLHDFLKAMPSGQSLVKNFVFRNLPDRREVIMVQEDFDGVKALAKKLQFVAVLHLILISVIEGAGFMVVAAVNNEEIKFWLFNHNNGETRASVLEAAAIDELKGDLLSIGIEVPRLEEIQPVLHS
jgi:hypothetical protein